MRVAGISRIIQSVEAMRVFLLLPFLIVSCAREAVVSPDPESVPLVKKSHAGKVTFAGLSPNQLSRIRVIPESGRKLIAPKNQVYDQVDGFWWEGEPERWFKIPDFSEAWVVGNPPEEFVKLPEEVGLPVAVRNLGIPSWVRLAMGKVGEPGWYPDVGSTRSPVPSPWRP